MNNKIEVSAEVSNWLQDNGLTPIGEHPVHPGWDKYELVTGYKMRWIARGVGDQGRLSGMSANTAKEYPPSPAEREKKGTFLKVGKFLRAIGVSEDKVQQLAQELSAWLRSTDPTNNIEFHLTNAPSTVYGDGLDYANCGTLGESCMQGKPYEYFDIYDNQENCQLLYAVDDYDVILGRALIWHDVEPVNADIGPITIMDRIYVAEDWMELAFKRYAREKGWWTKTHQSYSEPSKFTGPNGEVHELDILIKVTSDIETLNAFPYVDTFFNVIRKYGNYYLANYVGGHVVTCLRETDGVDSSGYFIKFCDYCSARLSFDESYEITDGHHCCEYCFDQNYTYCDDCEEVVELQSAITVCEFDPNLIRGTDIRSGLVTALTVCERCAEEYPLLYDHFFIDMENARKFRTYMEGKEEEC